MTWIVARLPQHDRNIPLAQADSKRQPGEAAADDRDRLCRWHDVLRWRGKLSRRKAMAEQTRRAFVQSPLLLGVGPEAGELAVPEPGPDTRHRVVSGHAVAANASEQPRCPEWK